MNRHEEIMTMIGTNPDAFADMLVAWETELSKVMPPDYKDWWQNSKTEWPIVARMVIENLREREKAAWDMLPANEAELDLFGSGRGDWTDDLKYENGEYCNECIKCRQRFMGQKRRRICKACHDEARNEVDHTSGYVLCLYTYDYYKAEKAYAFSFDEKELAEYKETINDLYEHRPFVDPCDHEAFSVAETDHWTVKKVPFLHNDEQRNIALPKSPGSVPTEWLEKQASKYRNKAESNPAKFQDYRRMAWACEFVKEIWKEAQKI